jgi:hypothetical protein
MGIITSNISNNSTDNKISAAHLSAAKPGITAPLLPSINIKPKSNVTLILITLSFAHHPAAKPGKQ